MVDAVIGVRLKPQGQAETKAALQETHAAILGVSSAKLQEAKDTRTLATDARNLNNELKNQTQIWLAQHPAIEKTSQLISIYGNVSRTALAVTSAFSLASVAFAGANSDLMDIQGQLAQAERDKSLALSKYGYDSTQYADAAEKVDVLTQKYKEFKDKALQGSITNIVNLASSVGLLTASLFTTIPAVVAATPAFWAMSFSIGGMTIAAAPLIIAIVAIAAVVAALIIFWPQLTDAFNSTIKAFQDAWKWITGIFVAHWREIIIGLLGPVGLLVVGIVDNWDSIVKAFTDAFNFIHGGFVAFWNGLVTVANTAIGLITSGIESLANGFIALINGIIGGINAIGSAIGAHPIGLIPKVSIPKITIPVVAAATGFDGLVNKPTMFLAGEAGAESVSITPTGSGGRRNGGGAGGGASAINISINVMGSMAADEAWIKKMDDAFRRSLKRSGFQV